MKLLVISANVLGWPLLQLSFSFVFLRLPDRWFAQDSWLTRPLRCESKGELYRHAFAIHRWKRLLPDGARWMGGRAKTGIVRRNAGALMLFTLETRRAEIAHWSMLLCTPIFYLWNPGWACLVMTLYGVATNLPCILVQRANRIKSLRLLDRS